MLKSRITYYLIISIILSLQISFTQEDNKVKTKKKDLKTKNLTNNEQLELFNKVYNNLENSYVDSIDQSKVVLSGIKGMLNSLDPYTKILMGASKERYEVLARGKYGGVGMSIDQVRDTITHVP